MQLSGAVSHLMGTDCSFFACCVFFYIFIVEIFHFIFKNINLIVHETGFYSLLFVIKP
ncbi:MAG: hypothetical protein JWO44_2209 [Bacteroidetes bacterium]|nr:hypothetical protein [Bacteroidota bacterium]